MAGNAPLKLLLEQRNYRSPTVYGGAFYYLDAHDNNVMTQ